MTNIGVIEAFIRGKCGSSNNLMSTGIRLFSYDTCIAEWYDTWIGINKTKYSVTTSKHVTMLERSINDRINTRYIYNIKIGSDSLNFITNETR